MARHFYLASVLAASAAATAFAAAAADQPTSVSELIVTAEKRSESLEKVPISVKAVTGATLDTIDAESAEDYLRMVPGVSMTNLARGGNQIQIRGLGSNVGNVGTVAVYNDGVVAPNRIQQSGTFSEEDPALFDIDRVEVLRGPQGTLYGEGSLGGVINIISKQPVLDRLEAAASATWFNRAHGSSDNKDFAAMINLPIIKDVLGIRLVGYSYDHDGWISLVDPIPPFFEGGAPATLVKKNANTENVTGGRAIAAFKPNETFDATFIFKAERTAVGAAPFASPQQIALANELGGTNFAPNYSQSDFLANSAVAKTTQGILQMNLHTAIGDLTSLSGYGEDNSVSSTTAISHDRAWDEELRLSSKASGPLTWIVGGYYRNATAALDLAGVGPFATDKSIEEAVFGQAYWNFASGWTATVGLREAHQTSDVTQVTPPLASHGSFDSFVPKFTLQYQHDPDAPLFYATVAKGFRAGGANVDESEGTDPTFTGPFNPDTIWNYEVGSKATFLGGKLTVNAAAFYIDWSDVQIDRPIISLINPPVGFIVVNGSAAHSYGVEADVYIYPTPNWTVTLGGSALNAGFDSGVITGVEGTVPLKGQTFSSTPKYTANLSVERRIALPDHLEGYIRGDYTYRSSSFGDVPNNQYDPPFVGALGVPGNLASGISQLVNLRAGIRQDNWDIQVFCTNVFDTHASTFTDFDGGFTDLVVELPPRTIGINLKLRYH